MKKIFFSISIILIAIILLSCSDTSSNPDNQTVLIKEVWKSTANQTTDTGSWTLEKKSDNTIVCSGNWNFNWNGITCSCPFTNGVMTVKDSVISFTANGTATYPGAPEGYKTSSFTLKSDGVCINGIGSGNFNIKFSQIGWPQSIDGNWTSVRQSGSGITK